MSGIFTLSIECVGGRHLAGPYQFVMEVPIAMTLDELRSRILGVLDFDGDHMDEFYVANTPYSKKSPILPSAGWDEDDSAVMDVPLSALFPLAKNKKLHYYYDFGASWRFQITKKGKETLPEPGIEYPCIVSETGVKPQEYGDDDTWD